MSSNIHCRVQPYEIHLAIYGDSREAFKELIQRGANLWPDAPPEIKELADLITSDGRVMQDYAQQGNFKPRPE